MNYEEFLKMLRERIASFTPGKGQTHLFADYHGISRQYLYDILNQKTPPGPKLLKAIGYKKQVRYVPAEEEVENDH